MTDITELVQSLKAAAEHYQSVQGIARYSKTADAKERFLELANPANILALVEALEKAKGMKAYWKTQCRWITDYREELQARIAELESRTVKIPYLPDDCDRTEAHYKYQAALRDAGIKVEAE